MPRKAPINRSVCGPRKGSLRSAARGRLPDRAFGLPVLRKYPLYVLVGGEAVPDREHAINAKARATQQYERGALTRAQLQAVHRRADAVIRLCRGPGARSRPAPRKGAPKPRGKLTVKLYCTDGHVHTYPVGSSCPIQARALAREKHAEHPSPCAVGIVDQDGIIVEQWEDGGPKGQRSRRRR